MITMGKYEIDSMVGDRRMPEWVRSERYEFCEGFYEGCTGKKNHTFWTKLASVFTAVLH
jgi:hypothetical protein